MTTDYDVIIVGTGQAGPALANRFHAAGLRTAVIERHRIGGTCTNVGCTPTKALVASARVAHMARRASDFGVAIEGPVTVDMRLVHERMASIAGRSHEVVTEWLDGMDNVTVHHGHGRFTAPDTVAVNGQRLRAPRIFINVGARAFVPDLPGLAEVDYLTSTGLLGLTRVPRHLIIVGGSYVGLEFAQMFRRFGSRVTVIERGERLIRRDDEDVSDAVREILEAEGIEVRLGAECVSATRTEDGIGIRVACAAGAPEIAGSHLLLAVGRTPNTDDLGLDAAGIAVDERGFIAVDDDLFTGVAGVYALGDCNGRGAFTHTSYNDHEIVAANLLDGDERSVCDRVPCYGLFIDPPLGRVGMTEQEARASGRRVLIGKRSMRGVGRARERSETDGFIKILVDADSREILGAAILGINGDEVVHTLSTAMYAGAPYTVVSRAVHIHPTVAELLPTVLQNLEPLPATAPRGRGETEAATVA